MDPFTNGVSKRCPMMVETKALDDTARFLFPFPLVALGRLPAGMKLRRGGSLVLEPRGCETTSCHLHWKTGVL